MKTPLTYKDAGVDINAGNAFVNRIKPFIQKTQRVEVISSLGGFAGLFSINPLKYKNPVLVSTTDGVGTKLKLALQAKRYRDIGQDLVAMCVNDLLCSGAEPLFFLDYLATSKLEIDVAAEIIEGIAESLQQIHCTLIGGETAEMPGFYQEGELDLAGFAVGIVDRDEMIDGSSISIGDQVIGLASSGLHSNGFSLVRQVLKTNALDLNFVDPALEKPLSDILLTPTRIYVNPILGLKRAFQVLGIAHITGGGLLENPPRIFPKQCRAIVQKSAWEMPPIFHFLQQNGDIPESEMFRVFNCGIGLVLVVRKEQADDIVSWLASAGEKAWRIGEIVERKAGEEGIEIV